MKTPLYDEHIKLGARMGPFAGWDMPIQYAGILQEHEQTRSTCSLFDTSHMGEFDIRGPNAEKDVEHLVTQNVTSLKIGRCRYGFMLDEDGGVIDDLTVYRRSSDHFFLVVNAGTLNGDADWIRNQLSDDTLFTDLSPTRSKLDIQGPESRRCFEEAFNQKLPELGYFCFQDIDIANIPCTLSRTGYTGEWGYEIYFPDSEAGSFWNKFLAHPDVEPAGLGARDTLRLEMGYALYGHELSLEKSPFGASRGAFIDLNKNFTGKSRVEQEKSAGNTPLLVAIQLDTKQASREGASVFSGDTQVGTVTSGSFSPSLGTAIAMAYVEAEYAETGQTLELELRKKRLPGRIVDLPFYKKGTARRKIVQN